MAPERSLLAWRLTFLMMALSTTGVELASTDSRFPWQSLAWSALWMGCALLGSRLAPLPDSPKAIPPLGITVSLGLFSLCPFLLEPIRRYATGDGFPLEIQILFSLRNLGLALAACSSWLFCMRLSIIISLFLTLFTSTMTSHPMVLALLGVYVATGSIWLMLVYWDRLGGKLIRPDDSVTLQQGPITGGFPKWALGVILLFVGLVAGLVAVGPHQAMATLWELVPTSGGTGDYDPYSRGGVNDGDQEARGNNANSTGTIETDQFLDSPLPSLYDMVNDMFGEPFKNPNQERMIALEKNPNTRETEKTPADHLRPNREFSTHRKGPTKARDAESIPPRGLFEVEGQTPLYIRIATYDRFNGIEWKEEPFDSTPPKLEKLGGGRGFQFPGGPPATLVKTLDPTSRTHRIKVTQSPGSLVPTPPQTTRVKVGRVDQSDFFSWSQEGILRMADRSTPPGISIETDSRLYSPRSLATLDFSARYNTPVDWLSVHEEIRDSVGKLGLEWTANTQGSWGKIDAVVNHLRQDYHFDPQVTAPKQHKQPLFHFLLEEKAGPDYQFATAAVLILRSLGYPSRLACGYYISPTQYDPLTGHTPVTAADLHFWPEVRLPWGDWLVLEPTPGFEAPVPEPPLIERIFLSLQSLGVMAWRNKVTLLLLGLSCALILALRRRIEDRFWILVFSLFPPRNEKQAILRTLWLLEKRAQWLGCPRQCGQTVDQWLGTWKGFTGSSDFEDFSTWVQWAAYAPDREPPPMGKANHQPHKALLNQWTWAKCSTNLRDRKRERRKGTPS